MIQATFGVTQTPFHRSKPELLPQQAQTFDILQIHAQQGGFCVVVGDAGVGKTVLREHCEALGEQKRHVVVSFSRTLHTHQNILRQLAESFEIDPPTRELENALITAAFAHIREGKTLHTLIDEAHLLDMATLRKLRLMFDRFPSSHNLILFGQAELLYHLSMRVNHDMKSRISYSQVLYPLNDEDMGDFIERELDTVKLSQSSFDPAARALIVRTVQGNLRLCRNLAHGALIECCRQGHRQVSTTHVNDVLIQPHWRSHEEIITQAANQR